MADKKKWIQGAVKKPGALRAQAKKEGALENGISKKWMKKKLANPKTSATTKKRIRLAQTFSKMRKAKKK